jgi:hypothetical protein
VSCRTPLRTTFSSSGALRAVYDLHKPIGPPSSGYAVFQSSGDTLGLDAILQNSGDRPERRATEVAPERPRDAAHAPPRSPPARTPQTYTPPRQRSRRGPVSATRDGGFRGRRPKRRGFNRLRSWPMHVPHILENCIKAGVGTREGVKARQGGKRRPARRKARGGRS